MMNRGNIRKWLMLIALVFVTVAAGEVWGIRAAGAASPTKPITLRMMIPGEPTEAKLSHIFGIGGPASDPIVYNVMEPLVDVDKEGEPIPRLATKWQQLSPTTWRFYLRKGVKFHNGADFTARDVVELAKWSREESATSVLYQNVPVKEAVAVDDYTVDLIFGKPWPLFLITGRMFLIPPLAISRDNREMAKKVVIGTGPCQFVEWKRGQYIKLAKFKDYWGIKPQIDEVVITFREEEAVRMAALMAGEVDWIYGLSEDLASNAPKVGRRPSPETVMIRFDEYIQKELGKVSIFADKRLRLAVEYAIDRQALVALYGGMVTPSLGQFASPGDFGFSPDLKSRPYNVEKARGLVKETSAVGKTVTLMAATDKWLKAREVAEAVAYMIEQTGLKVKLLLVPTVEAQKSAKPIGENRKYMVDLLLKDTDALLEVENRFNQFFVQGGQFNSIDDLEPTRLYKEVLAETDYAKRGRKLAKAWEYVYEQSHHVPLFKRESLWGLAKNLQWNIDIAGRPFIADMRFTDKP